MSAPSGLLLGDFGDCGGQHVGKTVTPSLHSLKRQTARARITAHLPSLSHSKTTFKMATHGSPLVSTVRSPVSQVGTSFQTGHSTGRQSRLDPSRRGTKGQAGGLSLNYHPLMPRFFPSSRRRCLCTNTPPPQKGHPASEARGGGRDAPRAAATNHSATAETERARMQAGLPPPLH